MTRELTESTPLADAALPGTSGRMLIQIITPGVGSSGYYSPAVLEAAARDRLVTRGTAMFLDHASESEHRDRPERSVRDIAAVFTEDAQWTGQALVAEAQVFTPYRELLTEMAEHVGVSISGSATDVTVGEIDGRRVPIIEGLARINSVDFVTAAGRGGRVLSVLESARERTAAEVHEALQAPTPPANPPNVPVAPAADPTEESRRTPMLQIEEAEHSRLVEAAGRVQAAEAQAQTDRAAREAAERRAQVLEARDTARPIAAAVLAESRTLPAVARARVVEGLLATVPLTAQGALDEAALRTRAEAARTAAETELAETLREAGYGTPRDLTPTDPADGGDGITESEFASKLGLTRIGG